MATSNGSKFRAIVIGAGVTGLTAAHTFHKAGIDYVVAERWSEAAPAAGGSIGIFPHVLRVLRQLGLLERAEKLAEPFTDGATNRYPDGSVLANSDLWGYFRENHGRDVLLLERRAFLELLYDTLPDKSKIQFNKELIKVVEAEDGVEAFFSDGTSEKGDIVVGSDGVHSAVRQAMWDHANAAEPGIITVEEKKAILTTWTCLFGFGPGEPHLRNELSVSSYDGKRCALVATQPKQSFFFFFWKPDKPWSRYTRPKYTAHDAEQAAASVADLPINETMVFADLWNKKHRAQLADIEEGVLSRWHYGRFVLVGDAAHKVTPNMALGGNLGIESVVVLTNLLHRASADPTPRRKLSTADLDALFQQYQAHQHPRARAIFEISGFVSRVQAWDTAWMKFSSIHIAPRTNPRALPDALGEIVRKAAVLDFLPLAKDPVARLQWENGKEDAERAAAAVAARKSGTAVAAADSSWPMTSVQAIRKIVFGGAIALPFFLWVLTRST